MSEGLTHRAPHTALVDEEEQEPLWLREASEDVGMSPEREERRETYSVFYAASSQAP